MKSRALFSLFAAVLIFGTVGIFRRQIPFSSELIAFSRGLIGFVFIAVYLLVKKANISFDRIGKKFIPLCVSGAIMGFNWLLLFEAYNYTSVATATLCYYMAPVIVILVSPFLFREKTGFVSFVCVVCAVAGMVLVSGVTKSGFGGTEEIKGVAFGLSAALLYAGVIVSNKLAPGVPAMEKTFVQLGSAAAVLFAYCLVTGEFFGTEIEISALPMLLAVGIVHTGIAYVLYFGSISYLPATTTAIFSYIDPVTAIILSDILLGEKMDTAGIIGAVLIIGSAVLSEVHPVRKIDIH